MQSGWQHMISPGLRAVALATALTGLGGCGGDEMLGPEGGSRPVGGFDWRLPEGFPTPRVDPGNPMNPEKVELGRRLFYDTRLSGNQEQSCASCHMQELAFTDGLPRSMGSTGDLHPRASMSLVNVGYQPVLTWANPLLNSLATQSLIPLFGEEPVEMGLSSTEQLLQRLAGVAVYEELFPTAFPEEPDPFTLENVTRALEAFQKTLISGNSPVDRFRRGDTGALSASAQLGQALFFSERLECFHCHQGLFFTGTTDFEGKSFPEIEFHNTGLYNIDGQGGYPDPNQGLWVFTGRPGDMGRFKAPTLRNVEVTAPYMHDGSIATLEEVIDHYAAGGRTITSGPNAGIGSLSPLKSGFMGGFTLTPEERRGLLDYLRSLTDREFLTDPRFSDPWAPGELP